MSWTRNLKRKTSPEDEDLLPIDFLKKSKRLSIHDKISVKYINNHIDFPRIYSPIGYDDAHGLIAVYGSHNFTIFKDGVEIVPRVRTKERITKLVIISRTECLFLLDGTLWKWTLIDENRENLSYLDPYDISTKNKQISNYGEFERYANPNIEDCRKRRQCLNLWRIKDDVVFLSNRHVLHFLKSNQKYYVNSKIIDISGDVDNLFAIDSDRKVYIIHENKRIDLPSSFSPLKISTIQMKNKTFICIGDSSGLIDIYLLQDLRLNFIKSLKNLRGEINSLNILKIASDLKSSSFLLLASCDEIKGGLKIFTINMVSDGSIISRAIDIGSIAKISQLGIIKYSQFKDNHIVILDSRGNVYTFNVTTS